MSEGAFSHQEQGTEPRLQLVVCWADFTKARAIYPEANERVQSKLREMLAALAACVAHDRMNPAYDNERGVTLLFRERCVVFGPKEEVEIHSGSVLAWLRQRVTHSGLAGIEWMPNLTAESLLAFTTQLLGNFLRKEPDLTFRDLWPVAFDGLVLIDRRFEGTFGGHVHGGSFAGGHAGTSIEGSDKRSFVTGLLSHPKVAKRVAALQKAVGELEEDVSAETVRTTDVLRRILDDVPAEALKSRDSLLAAVCKVMDGLTERSSRAQGELGGGLGSAPRTRTSDDAGETADGSGSDFASLLYQVSRTHFARKGPGLERLKADQSEIVDPSPAGGRSRDAEITDDVQALLGEVSQLPAQAGYDLERGDADSRAEQIAVFLHYLVNLERPEELTGLYPTLDRLLQGASAQELVVLREYLQDTDVDEQTAKRRRGAILQFLMRAGRTKLLRDCGILTREFVLEDIGRRLPVYLASLDVRSTADLLELNQLCASVGARLFDYEDTLRHGLADLRRDQAAGLFHRPHPARLPLLRQLLAVHPGRLVPEATVYLRSLDLPEDESFLLFQLHDMAYLRRVYLCTLIDLHLGRVEPDVVRRIVVDLLCRHIRATRDPIPAHPERLESIRCLARYPSANGWFLLRELAKTWFGPFGGAEPASVRRLARSVARDMKEQDFDRPEPDLRLDAAGHVTTQAPLKTEADAQTESGAQAGPVDEGQTQAA